MTNKSSKLYGNLTLVDIVRKFGNFPPSETGSEDLNQEIAHYIFENLRSTESDLKVNEVWETATYLGSKLREGYLIINRNQSKKLKVADY